MFAYNSEAPEEQRWSLESDKSELASLGKPGERCCRMRCHAGSFPWVCIVQHQAPGLLELYSKCACALHTVSPTTAGIPAAITAATGLRKLKVQFSVPNPDAAVYYEYSVRDASNLVRGGQGQLQPVSWTFACLLCSAGHSCISQTSHHSLGNCSPHPPALWQAISSNHRFLPPLPAGCRGLGHPHPGPPLRGHRCQWQGVL